MLVNTGAAVGSVALIGSGANLVTLSALQSVYGIGTGVTGLAFDRAKEKEADRIGLTYMALAGYNPEESVRVLDKLDTTETASGRNLPPALLSTHPSNPERIVALLDAMPEALKVYQKSAAANQPVLVR